MTLPTLPTPEQAFEQYRPLVENNEQAQPMLLFAGTDRCGLAVLEVDAQLGLQPVLGIALPDLALNLGTARWVLLSIEAYSRPVATFEEAAAQAGTLGAAAAAGDTTVRDCVQISGVSADGQKWDYLRTFTRTPGGVVWDEPHISNEAQGGVIDMLLHAVR